MRTNGWMNGSCALRIFRGITEETKMKMYTKDFNDGRGDERNECKILINFEC